MCGRYKKHKKNKKNVSCEPAAIAGSCAVCAETSCRLWYTHVLTRLIFWKNQSFFCSCSTIKYHSRPQTKILRIIKNIAMGNTDSGLRGGNIPSRYLAFDGTWVEFEIQPRPEEVEDVATLQHGSEFGDGGQDVSDNMIAVEARYVFEGRTNSHIYYYDSITVINWLLQYRTHPNNRVPLSDEQVRVLRDLFPREIRQNPRERLAELRIQETEYEADRAAFVGHLEVLTLLHDLGIDATSEEGADDAAGEGHLDVLRQLHEWGIDATSRGADDAARRGHLNVLRRLHEWGINATSRGADWAAEAEHLNVLRKLHDWGINATSGGVFKAVVVENLNVLRKFREWGIDMTSAGAGANRLAAFGRVDVLGQLHDEFGINATSQGADSAASNGHLNTLRQLREWGIHATSEGADGAARESHLNVLRQLHEWDIDVTQYGAERARNSEVLNQLREWGLGSQRRRIK